MYMLTSNIYYAMIYYSQIRRRYFLLQHSHDLKELRSIILLLRTVFKELSFDWQRMMFVSIKNKI